MGSRRPHAKTRNCNLQGPVCSNCQRRRELCDYTLGHSTVTSQAAAVPALTPGRREFSRAPTGASISAALANIRTSPQPSLVQQESLIDVVRWFEASCEPPRTMVPTPYLDSFEFRPQYSSNPQIFQYLIPHVTAVSTLRSLRRAASRDAAGLASAYRASVAASAAFRAVERAVTDANWPAILLFTLCHQMFSFAAAAHFAPPPHFDYLEVFQRVLRGTGAVRTQLLRRLLRLGILSEMPFPQSPASQGARDAETDAALELLASARHPAATPAATVAACAEALALLRRWVHALGGRPTQWAHFFFWPCAVSQTFVLALGERQPVATLIFVHWCAVMHRAPDTWFLDGWARRTALAAVAAIAPVADCDLLRWPMSVFDQDLGDGPGKHDSDMAWQGRAVVEERDDSRAAAPPVNV